MSYNNAACIEPKRRLHWQQFSICVPVVFSANAPFNNKSKAVKKRNKLSGMNELKMDDLNLDVISESSAGVWTPPRLSLNDGQQPQLITFGEEDTNLA